MSCILNPNIIDYEYYEYLRYSYQIVQCFFKYIRFVTILLSWASIWVTISKYLNIKSLPISCIRYFRNLEYNWPRLFRNYNKTNIIVLKVTSLKVLSKYWMWDGIFLCYTLILCETMLSNDAIFFNFEMLEPTRNCSTVYIMDPNGEVPFYQAM